VDSASSIGDCSLQQINGFPAIAYQRKLPHDLYYAYSTSPDGSAGWNSVELDSASEIESNVSLAEIDGKPAVAAYLTTTGSGGEVHYLYSSTDDGGSGWTSSAVDSGDTCGFGCTLANVGDTPGLIYCYYSLGVYYVRYAKNTAADGSGAWTFGQLTSDVGLPDYLNLLVLSNGNPVASYLSLNDSLFFARSSAPEGGNWSKVGLLGQDTGNANSLALVNGKPAISTRNSDFTLYFGRPATTDGTGSWVFNTVPGTTFTGASSCLAEIDGRPAIAFRTSPGGMFYATLFE
jgi:hypothetical protein